MVIEKGDLYGVFCWNNVQFKDLVHFVRYFKTHPDFTLERLKEETKLKQIHNEPEFLPIYEEFLKQMENLWDVVDPYTPLEVLTDFSDNAEKRYLLLGAFTPEQIALALDSTLIDEQTLTKVQKKTRILGDKNQHDKVDMKNLKPDDLYIEEIEYSDTYALLKIDGEKFGTEDDVAIVRCQDTSTDKTYYLFVDGAHTDAIEAIASTMRKDDGSPLSKEEYLSIESET